MNAGQHDQPNILMHNSSAGEQILEQGITSNHQSLHVRELYIFLELGLCYCYSYKMM